MRWPQGRRSESGVPRWPPRARRSRRARALCPSAASKICTPGDVIDRICMWMPVAFMSSMRREPRSCRRSLTSARAFARIFEVVAHQAVEADVVRTLARQQLAVGADQVFRGERFFRGDAFEAEVIAQDGAPVVRPRRPVVGPARSGVSTVRRRACRAPTVRQHA